MSGGQFKSTCLLMMMMMMMIKHELVSSIVQKVHLFSVMNLSAVPGTK